MNLDIQKIKTDIHQTAEEIRELKKILRESGQPRKTYSTEYSLLSLKGHATVLCSIRAHMRGKVHQKDFTLEKQSAFIAKACPAFEKAVEEAA